MDDLATLAPNCLRSTPNGLGDDALSEGLHWDRFESLARRCNPRALGFVLTAMCCFGLATQSATAANIVVAGDDPLFTIMDTFLDSVIPAGFFDPGSDPYAQSIELVGQPLAIGSLDETDTIVRRLDDALVSVVPSSDTVDAQLVSLCLVGGPITVTYGGTNDELWDVRVELRNELQPIGTMTINRDTEAGGTFTTDVPGKFLATFTRLSDSTVRTLSLDETLTTDGPPGPWSENGPVGVSILPGQLVPTNCDGSVTTLSTGTGNFLPGILDTQPGPPDPLACKVIVINKEQMNNARHVVSVPRYPNASCCWRIHDIAANDMLRTQCKKIGGGAGQIAAKACFELQKLGIADMIAGNGADCSMLGSCCTQAGQCIPDSTKCCCEINGGIFSGVGEAECTTGPCAGAGVPSLSQWGLIVLGLLLIAGMFFISKRRDVSAQINTGLLFMLATALIGVGLAYGSIQSERDRACQANANVPTTCGSSVEVCSVEG